MKAVCLLFCYRVDFQTFADGWIPKFRKFELYRLFGYQVVFRLLHFFIPGWQVCNTGIIFRDEFAGYYLSTFKL